jgi:hypothetical protein
VTIHNFTESNRKGKVGESILSAFFESKGYTVTPATLSQQKEEHWDLKLTKENIETKYIEVKTEYRAESTGNVFWEMDVNGKPGWTQLYSDSTLNIFLTWLLPVSRTVYILKANRLQELTEYIESEFKDKRREVYNTASTTSGKHVSWGYLVPLSWLSTIVNKFKV